MSGGFWAGAVPPWAFVVWVGTCALFLVMGVWVGLGRRQAEAEEEARWAREQAKAHPVYRQPPELTHEQMFPWAGTANTATGPIWEYRADHPELDGQVVQVPAITTGEIQAITGRVDEWMATWIGQEAGRG